MFISIKRLTKLLTLILIFSFTTIYADTELNLPAFSQLGKEIANGRAVYSDNFYWINADGTIGSTNRGWSRVPKESRNLVYLSMQDAQSSLDEYSITDEERAEQARKEAEEKAEQARKEAQAREATKKRKEQEETAAKNQAAYLTKCEGGVSDDPFAAFDSQDTSDRMKLTVKYGGNNIKLQANESGCLWEEDPNNANVLPKLIDWTAFQQNPNNSSQFVISVDDGSLILDFTKYQCLSKSANGTTQKLECYDSLSPPTPPEKKVTKSKPAPQKNTPAPKPKKKKPAPAPAPAIAQISCTSLINEFEVNEMRTIRKYKGKEVIITGRVSSIDSDFWDNAQINLKGDEWGFQSCMLSPPTNNQDFAYDLDKGQYVKLKCKEISEVMGFPQAKSCKLVN